jgi:hypothetical protein
MDGYSMIDGKTESDGYSMIDGKTESEGNEKKVSSSLSLKLGAPGVRDAIDDRTMPSLPCATSHLWSRIVRMHS